MADAGGCLGNGTAVDCSRRCEWPFVDDLVDGAVRGNESGGDCALSAGEHMGMPFLLWSGFIAFFAAAIGGFAFHRALLLNWFGGWTPLQTTVQAKYFYLALLFAVGLSLNAGDMCSARWGPRYGTTHSAFTSSKHR